MRGCSLSKDLVTFRKYIGENGRDYTTEVIFDFFRQSFDLSLNVQPTQSTSKTSIKQISPFSPTSNSGVSAHTHKPLWATQHKLSILPFGQPLFL